MPENSGGVELAGVAPADAQTNGPEDVARTDAQPNNDESRALPAVETSLIEHPRDDPGDVASATDSAERDAALADTQPEPGKRQQPRSGEAGGGTSQAATQHKRPSTATSRRRRAGQSCSESRRGHERARKQTSSRSRRGHHHGRSGDAGTRGVLKSWRHARALIEQQQRKLAIIEAREQRLAAKADPKQRAARQEARARKNATNKSNGRQNAPRKSEPASVTQITRRKLAGRRTTAARRSSGKCTGEIFVRQERNQEDIFGGGQVRPIAIAGEKFEVSPTARSTIKISPYRDLNTLSRVRALHYRAGSTLQRTRPASSPSARRSHQGVSLESKPVHELLQDTRNALQRLARPDRQLKVRVQATKPRRPASSVGPGATNNSYAPEPDVRHAKEHKTVVAPGVSQQRSHGEPSDSCSDESASGYELTQLDVRASVLAAAAKVRTMHSDDDDGDDDDGCASNSAASFAGFEGSASQSFDEGDLDDPARDTEQSRGVRVANVRSAGNEGGKVERAQNGERQAQQQAEFSQQKKAIQAYANACDTLEKSVHVLGTLQRTDLFALASRKEPPKVVLLVMGAVCTLLDLRPTFHEARRAILDRRFVRKFAGVRHHQVEDKTLKQLNRFLDHPNFTLMRVSKMGNRALSALAQHAFAVRDAARLMVLADEASSAKPETQ